MIDFDASTLQQAFREATESIAASVDESALRAAGWAGAEVFLEEARRNAARNVKTGTLYRNIIVKRLEEESDSAKRQAYIVTVRTGKFGKDGDAFYWRFVEGGHRFVRRNTKKGKAASLKMRRKASELEYGTASAPAYPFMRPAYESKKDDALDAMRAQLAQTRSE
ncbi:MAG TPA: HK97-gp10 family putative phage morphogenesis protein [Telluria sp.]